MFSCCGAATGCMNLRGLEKQNLPEGYSVNGLSNLKTCKGSHDFPRNENRQAEFMGHVIGLTVFNSRSVITCFLSFP